MHTSFPNHMLFFIPNYYGSYDFTNRFPCIASFVRYTVGQHMLILRKEWHPIPTNLLAIFSSEIG